MAKIMGPLLCLMFAVSAWAAGPGVNDFPTAARVEYVLACASGQLSRAVVQGCVCRIDALAARLSYDEWVAVETALSLQSVPGQRATAIRGIGWVKDLVTRFRSAEADVELECR